MSNPFTMSIEFAPLQSRQHGFHLGTDEKLARQIVTEKYAAMLKTEQPVVTIALMRNGHIVDVWDGSQWSSDINFDDESAYEQFTYHVDETRDREGNAMLDLSIADGNCVIIKSESFYDESVMQSWLVANFPNAVKD
jgi:hypothetical protein